MDAQVNKVAEAITFLRKRAGFTQKDLAERIGISDKAVSKWERGIGMPDVAYLRKLSILLDTDTDSLLAGDVISRNNSWRGLLVLEDGVINLASKVYDKPLCYILLSYFILVGIKKINIVCSEKDINYLEREFQDGECLGLELSYHDIHEKMAIRKTDFGDCSNVMIIFGKEVIYGVDQTRFFQKAMFYTDRVSVMALPKGNRSTDEILCFNSDRKVILNDEDEALKTQYNYSDIPIAFAPIGAMEEIFKYGKFDIQKLINGRDLYIEVLDRGFVEFDIKTIDDLKEASDFIRLVQKRCGMNVYCIEEVAWRRGFVEIEFLKKRSEKYKNSEYGEYLIELYEKMK